MASPQLDKDITQAQSILRGQGADVQVVWALARRLKNERYFGYTRRLLAVLQSDPRVNDDSAFKLKIIQQRALCTYKDADLSADLKFDEALEILKAADLRNTENQETLGIAGAIHKYKWEVFGQKEDLERSLVFYRRGYKVGSERDNGYTAINTAFVLDVLSALEASAAGDAGGVSEAAESRRDAAREIRQKLVALLPTLTVDESDAWWTEVTIGEALFGLGRYDEAAEILNRAKQRNVSDWERESTARQLASLARLQHPDQKTFKNTRAWKVLLDFLDGRTAAVDCALLGKIGLALSGGGFRASFFHLGVLAKLAELGILQRVEAISCVSGGSIIGACYYLEVRKLLQAKPEEQISEADYVQIVRELIDRFLKAVQQNIRTQIAADFRVTLRATLLGPFSRIERAGELYDRLLYADDRSKERPRLKDLRIIPKGDEACQPKQNNWRRKAKIPVLVINATTLNTGHNFQFTASWMGEPPANVHRNIDANYRLRRMYHGESPGDYKEIPLGRVVAASACVPGVFEPVVLQDLYHDRIRDKDLTVRLVDGGVHDNQGLASLFEQDCEVLLVSDASGQMVAEDEPSGGVLGLFGLLRTNTIFQARLREAQYRDLEARTRSSLRRGFMFLHMTKDLDAEPIDWKDSKDPYEASLERKKPKGILTEYGIERQIQQALSAIRTDLDSFSEAEAYALMLSGFRMTQTDFPRSFPGFPGSTADSNEPWKFLKIERAMRMDDRAEHARLLELLKVGKQSSMKVWALSSELRSLVSWGGRLAMLAAIVVGLALLYLLRGYSWPVLGAIVAVVVAGALIVRKRFPERVALALIGMGAWAASRAHLRFFDPRFLDLGRLDRILEKK